MKQKNLLLIGLVNQDKPDLGDTKHFNRLLDYHKSNFPNKVYSISISNSTKGSESDLFVKLPTSKLYRIFYWNFQVALTVLYLIVFKRVRFVYMRFNGTSVLPLFMLRLLKTKYALEINGIEENIKKKLTWIYGTIISNAEIICGAPGYMKFIKKSYTIEDTKLCSVSLGYDFQKSVTYNKYNVAAQLGLDESLLYFTFIGNIQHYQGLQYIVDALIENKTKIPNQLKFLIIGDGPLKSELHNKIIQNGLTQFFQFIPRQQQENLDRYLSIDSIGLSPFSPTRGIPGSISGLKTFDYIAHKMPILTSLMDEKAEMIEEDEIGWVIKSFEPQNVFQMILKSYQEYEKMKSNIELKYDSYKDTFTWDNRFRKIKQEILNHIIA